MNHKYIDANIFIQAILRNDDYSLQILNKIIKRDFIGITSIVSWDELVFIIRKFIGREIAIFEGKKFLRFPNLIFIDANKKIIFYAQNLIEKYNLRPRDAIHAATALCSGINEIISDDSDFDKISELKRVKVD